MITPARNRLTENLTLTPRELEAAKCCACGWDAKATGEAMGCCTETARQHVKNALRKLGLDNKPMLAVWYVRNYEMRVQGVALPDLLQLRELVEGMITRLGRRKGRGNGKKKGGE
jgi:DNA-binding CsgD family transcriptional regulator